MKRILVFVISLILFVLVLVYGILNKFFIDGRANAYFFVFAFLFALNVAVVSFIINYQRTLKMRRLEKRLTAWSSLSYHVNKIGDEAFNELPLGIIIYEKETLYVHWHNKFAETVFLEKQLENARLADLSSELVELVYDDKKVLTITIDKKEYDLIHNDKNQVIYMFDVSEREKIKRQYQNQLTALGIIYLDNVEESLQNYDIYEKSNIKGEYLGVITDWVSEHKGYLKFYTEDRMMVIFSYQELKNAIADKFDVLNKIREISTKHRIRISASIGISCYDTNYEELGTLAQNAIELAEKRGGDQVVVNVQHEKIAYFGGKSNASEKSSRVQVRIQSQNFKELIEAAKNVIVMAHKNADIDAFGAMIGIYKMALFSKVDAFVVVDETEIDETVMKIVKDFKAEKLPIVNAFVDIKSALGKISAETLLVIVDTQSPSIVASEELYQKASKVANIDHHRQSEESFKAQFNYVEPYASSSVELIAEMMEFYASDIELTPLEASAMYGGILVDTNDFTYRTGSRTFGAASYLKEYEASSAKVKEWLREDKERMLLTNELVSKVISPVKGSGVVIDRSNIIRDRTLLAQVSERLLDIKGVNASFTIARVSEDAIGISARSYDHINVQLIMEEMGGGGHLNSAATQVKEKSIDQVYSDLKNILMRELDESGEIMKVILLEDIKGKGKKDEIIDVPNGYGNYLIRANKGILATAEEIEKIEAQKELLIVQEREHLLLMKKLKKEIESKTVDVFINLGQDGKLFGSVTTKQITDAFREQHGIEFDRKKLELTSEINSIGIYTATVTLARDVKAQFEINVLEKQV